MPTNNNDLPTRMLLYSILHSLPSMRYFVMLVVAASQIIAYYNDTVFKAFLHSAESLSKTFKCIRFREELIIVFY